MQLVKPTNNQASPQSIDYASIEIPDQLMCLNGPCQGSKVDAPIGVVPGTATALKWQNVQNKDRFAVYVVVEHNGIRGLMYLKSYNRPFQAVQRVNQITAIAGMQLS
jgi:hypothetical protein